MKIACVGGGPAGLYFAISMKLRNPEHQVTVFERNRPGDTFGWGVVFSDQTMENLRRSDPISAKAMQDELTHWDDIEVHVGERMTSTTGHGRSEEHTSELQSLMRISYAVFCLKKTQNTSPRTINYMRP